MDLSHLLSVLKKDAFSLQCFQQADSEWLRLKAFCGAVLSVVTSYYQVVAEDEG